ncbi:hypothetical protein As57867_001714, partial [Aphanomyces stellatus]
MKGPKYASVSVETPAREHPLDQAGIFSKLFFGWAQPLLRLGNERQLHPDDVWPLQPENQCGVVGRLFEPAFTQSRSILWTMLSLFGWQWLVVGLMQMLAVVASFFGPYVLQQIVSSMETDSFDVNWSLLLIASLVAVRILAALLATHSSMQAQLIVIKVTSALQHLLFQKSLRLDAASRRTKSTGEISNLFLSDIPTIVYFSTQFNQLWILPLQVVLTLVMLYNLIGWSTFVGAGTILVMMAANNVMARALQQGFSALTKLKDTRMKAVNEVFGAIQIIKFNAWEEKFADKLHMGRLAELRTLLTIFIWNSVGICLAYLGPTLVTIASFATYTLVQHETLSASKLFTALNLFAMLKNPFIVFSFIVGDAMRSLVSIRRLMAFLDLDEKPTDNVLTPSTIGEAKLKTYAKHDVVVALDDVTIGWDDTKPLFEKLTLTIQRGELVVIHGAVGEGKSSLCAALLGEMDKFNGSIFVGGRVAYFAQQPWIQNLTIRENILFGKPYDRVKYNRVIDACALTKDLTLFPAG